MRQLTHWDDVLSTDETNEVLFLLSRWHLAKVEEPTRVLKEVFDLVRDRNFKGLCQYELRYEGLSVSDAAHLRQVLAFFQKRVDLDLGVDREAVAFEKFVASERKCLQTNHIFRELSSGRFAFLPDVEAVMYRAQCKIGEILGDVPSLEELCLRFGPGATTKVKRRDASARRKLSSVFACSEEAIDSLPAVLAEMPAWSGLEIDGTTDSVTVCVSVDDGKLTFVRKNAKTDRTVIVEPMLNSMVQLGIGDYLVLCLLREGIDLRDQTTNQRLAREGSLTGALATLDLSSASDLNACGAVETLLPVDWWLLLRSYRTGTVVHKGVKMRLFKFSSMGNGYTFPLETLIFYALARASMEVSGCSGGKISVYGDDIIVPVDAVPLLIRTLTAVGFDVNKSKSFWKGPFRESCGKDYMSGTDIRPCYIKDALSGETCFVLHNFYVRKGQPEPAAMVRDLLLKEPWVVFGPDGYGDGHLLGDYTPKPLNRSRGWGGFTFETYTRKARRGFYSLGADYVYPSYSIYRKGDGGPFDDVEISLDEIEARILLKAGKAWTRLRTSLHGTFRPCREDAVYVRYEGKARLADSLPGSEGYKRIKIYVAHRPL